MSVKGILFDKNLRVKQIKPLYKLFSVFKLFIETKFLMATSK